MMSGLAILAVVVCFVLGIQLWRARGDRIRLQSENQDLAVGASTAQSRLEDRDREIERLRTERDEEVSHLRGELAKHAGLDRSMQELTKKVGDAHLDASRAADGSSRVENHLLNFSQRIANPQSRGAFGEDVLRNQLENLGLEEGRDFEKQVKVEGGQRRVDYVVRLREVIVAIDPKFALDPDLAGLNEAMIDGNEVVLRAFAKKIIARARELAKKEYWRGLEKSPAFVLMYIPVEGALEALRAMPDFSLEKFSIEHGVYVVTPLQLGTTLGVIADVAHAAKRSEETDELARDLLTLDAELARLCELQAREGRQLSTLIGTHEEISSALGNRGGLGRIAKKVRAFSRRAHKAPEIAVLQPPRAGQGEAPTAYAEEAEKTENLRRSA